MKPKRKLKLKNQQITKRTFLQCEITKQAKHQKSHQQVEKETNNNKSTKNHKVLLMSYIPPSKSCKKCFLGVKKSRENKKLLGQQTV